MTTALATKAKTRPEGTVAASALLRAVLAVKPLAVKNRNHPVLMGARLEWDDDALTVSTSDMESWASYRVESAVCSQPGEVIVSASLLALIAKTTGKVVISATGEDEMRFATESGVTTIRQFPDGGEWPEHECPVLPDDQVWTINPEHVRALLPAVYPRGNSRPLLEVIAFQDGAMCATDSYRMHWLEEGVPDYPMSRAKHGTGVLIPGYALRWVAKEAELVTLAVAADASSVRMVGGSQSWTVITAKGYVMDGKDTGFPDWRSITTKSGTKAKHLITDRAELLKAVRHCEQINPGDGAYPVKMELTASSARIMRRIQDTCTMEATVVAKWDGPEVTQHFAGHYLAACLAAGSGDTVAIAFDPTNLVLPALITDDSPCKRLLMPVRMT